jgi:amidophosphoribosyltransferase
MYPGQAIIITRAGISCRQIAPPAPFAPDIFEFVYFSRPDSVLDGISVYRSRMAMGDALAEKVKVVLAEANIQVDVVIPVRTFPFLFGNNFLIKRCGLGS